MPTPRESKQTRHVSPAPRKGYMTEVKVIGHPHSQGCCLQTGMGHKKKRHRDEQMPHIAACVYHTNVCSLVRSTHRLGF